MVIVTGFMCLIQAVNKFWGLPDMSRFLSQRQKEALCVSPLEAFKSLVDRFENPEKYEDQNKLEPYQMSEPKNANYCRSCGRPSTTHICKNCGYPSLNINHDGDPKTEPKVKMPVSLTAENGAKEALIGEFFETIKITCCECEGTGFVIDYMDECESCGGIGYHETKVYVSWTNIKAIYKKAVKLLAL